MPFDRCADTTVSDMESAIGLISGVDGSFGSRHA